MPELPEVETIVRELRPRLQGQTIRRVGLIGKPTFREQIPTFLKSLDNFVVKKILRYGKRIYWHLTNEEGVKKILEIRLGMTGQMLWQKSGQALENHTHIVFSFKDGSHELRYRDIRRFGRFQVLSSLKMLPRSPDAWDDSVVSLAKAFRARRGMIKHALLNQNVAAGIGNIYADESLFLAKIHPRQKIEHFSNGKLLELCRMIKIVLRNSLKQGGTSFRNYVDIHGGRGGFVKDLHVYGKQGDLCACGTKIRRIVVASRGTHFCPRCQRLK